MTPRHLITSALPYINGTKHLGNLVGSMLPADVFARYLRLRGRQVLFVCGTDEHGTPAELAALAAGVDVATYCQRQYDRQASVYRGFGLSFDYFGRSSSAQNHELTRHFAGRLADRGLLEERTVEQVYSLDDRRFLPDRYIIGTCPHCGYEAARGDQCEHCTRLLDPPDLLKARSAVSGSTNLEVREARHLFLLQSKLAGQLREWIDAHGEWPVLVSSIARKWLDEGLADRGITRDLAWGVPVDRPGFQGKVFYVWFDAPVAYIAATRQWADADPGGRDWRSWWYDANDVRYTQFMAKDNIPFHTIGFPGTLLGSGEPWKLVDYLKGFNWLTYYGEKFSTSQRVGVFLEDALELLPADYWRWSLLANAPESDDAAFTWEVFSATVNADLADTLGNLVNRTLRLCARRFGPQVPAGGAPGPLEGELAASLAGATDAYTQHLARLEFRKASRQLRQTWALGNRYLERAAPWATGRFDVARTACTLRTAVNLLRVLAVLAAPVIPHTSTRLLAALGQGPATTWPGADIVAELAAIPAGQPFTIPEVLFAKISPDDVASWRQRFGGAAARAGAL